MCEQFFENLFHVAVTLLYINCYSVKLATSVQNVFTAGKLIAIGLIVCGGTYELLLGEKLWVRRYLLKTTSGQTPSNW